MEEDAPAPSPPLRKPSRASLRWEILRRALLSRSPTTSSESGCSSHLSTKSISRKIGCGFHLIQSVPLDGHLEHNLGSRKDLHVCYWLPVEGAVKLTLVQRTEDCIDLNDFELSTRYNIDTTGLVCSWPSEDVLAYFCLHHRNMFRSKRVLELGAGYGLAGLVVAATTDACEVVISDGNPQVVDYIQHNITLNSKIFGGTQVRALTLHWSQERPADIMHTFDIIIASDCTFFKEFHENLACTIASLLKHSENSEAIFFSPRRGNSLDKFLGKVKEIGLHFILVENYDSKVWSLHQKFMIGDDSSWPSYEMNHCYPILVRMGFKMFSS